jgi:aminoglycoside/choline kinase family phosphotransferase
MPTDTMLTVDAVQPLLQQLFPTAAHVPRIALLAADASTRRYFRIHWDAPVAGCPASCVLMVCEPWQPQDTPDFLAVGQHLRVHGVRVPEVYGVLPHQGLMCLEDYGDCTLAAQWQVSTPTEQLAWGQRAIDELVKMHTSGTQHSNPACPAFKLAFDVPKLLSELQFFREYAIEGLWQQTLTSTARDDLNVAFETLCVLLASAPRYFCHRDYHGWNIMACDGAVGVLDFQDARLGPQPYDLASLLTDRGTPGLLGSALMTALMDYYVQCMEAETGRRTDRDAFNQLFDYVAIQRCLKATGTFAAMAIVRQRPQYLPYIPPTLTYLQPLLQRYYVLQPLAGLLQHYVPLWQT